MPHDHARHAGRDQRVGARPVRPMWLQRLERDVGGRAAARCRRAARSAADLGVRAARRAGASPSPSTRPPRTMTQPTSGLGRVRPRARCARPSAWRMNALVTRSPSRRSSCATRRACRPPSNGVSSNTRSASSATACPISRSPKQMTLASLCCARQPRRGRLAAPAPRARPRTLLAAIEMPMPEPHTAEAARCPRSSSTTRLPTAAPNVGIVDRLGRVRADVDRPLSPRRRAILQVLLEVRSPRDPSRRRPHHRLVALVAREDERRVGAAEAEAVRHRRVDPQPRAPCSARSRDRTRDPASRS